MYYSGSDDSSNKYGVGVIINTKCVNTSVNLVPKSNRTMLLQIRAKPRNINIIQVYAPTTDGSDQEVRDFYKEIQDLLQMTKNHEINLVIGDFNAKVGKGEVPRIAGNFGLGARNERGDTLVQFCQECDFALSCRLKQLKKRTQYHATDARKLKEFNIRDIVVKEINEWAVDKKLGIPRTVEEEWSSIKNKLLTINETHLKRDWIPKQSWMTEKIYNLMEERKIYKNSDKAKYSEIDKKIRREVRYARDAWYQCKCDFVEDLYAKHDAFNLHKEK